MYTLLYILATPAFLGTYQDLESCKSVVRGIYTARLNMPGVQNIQLDPSIELRIKTSREFLCVPVAK